jgi:hypothetical protein
MPNIEKKYTEEDNNVIVTDVTSLEDLMEETELGDDEGGVYELEIPESENSLINFYQNLAEDMEEDELNDIAQAVLENYRIDKEARQKYEEELKLLTGSIGIGTETMSEPFEGACGAVHPLILENVVKSQSKASGEILPADGPVNTVILGPITLDKEKQAQRVKDHMNWQLTKEMTEFYPQQERLLFHLPLMWYCL